MGSMKPIAVSKSITISSVFLCLAAGMGWGVDEARGQVFELRGGYACCWCNLAGGHLILQPHPSSPCEPILLDYPNDADVVGRVVGVAMQLEAAPAKRKPKRKSRAAAVPKPVPGL